MVLPAKLRMKKYIRICGFLLLFGFSDLDVLLGQSLPELLYQQIHWSLARPEARSLPAEKALLQFVYPGAPTELEVPGFRLPMPGERLRFPLKLNGIPVQNAWMLIRKPRQGNHLLVQFPALDFSEWKAAPGNDAAVWVFDVPHWHALTVRVAGPKEARFRHWETSEGQVLYREEAMLYAGPDSLVKMTVFRPDPVSKLRLPYGGLLRDRADSNSVLLTQALDTVLCRVGFSADSFRLKNSRFELGEFSIPTRLHATCADPDSLMRNRAHPAFEELNAFYHLNRFRAYVDSLGFDTLAAYCLPVDAHGMDGADQSAFSTTDKQLYFGEGNVDDAEDAAVLVHEYGHALSHSALAFGNSGVERRALEEGFCDYLGGSYARHLSDYQWNQLFKWDGHNEFWDGRVLNTDKMYPTNLVGQMHKDGEIFSSALTQLENQTNRALVHELLLGSMPFFLPNQTMPAAAQIMLDTDSSLYNGQHSSQISQAFIARGINPGQIIVSVEKPGVQPLPIWLQAEEEGVVLHTPTAKEGRFEVFDLQGRCLAKGNLSGTKTRLNLPANGPGMRLVKVWTAQGIGLGRW